MIWSVSLVFYHHNYGYLLGQEYRKKEKGLNFHPVGGKVENYDKDPLDSAVREFIEETTLGLMPYFSKIADNNFKEWTKNNIIDLNTIYPEPSYWIQKNLYDFCNDSMHITTIFDHHLLNSIDKEHRYYIIDISKSSNREFAKAILNLPFEYLTLPNELRLNDKMWSLFWIPITMMHALPNPTNLISILYSKIIKHNKSYNKNKKNDFNFKVSAKSFVPNKNKINIINTNIEQIEQIEISELEQRFEKIIQIENSELNEEFEQIEKLELNEKN